MSEAFFFRAVVNVIFDPLFVADSIRAVGGSQIARNSVHYAESFYRVVFRGCRRNDHLTDCIFHFC